MALCTDDGQTTCSLNLRRELNIGTTTSHVGGDGNGTLSVGALSGQCYDVGLLLVQLSVQHLVGDTLALASFRIYVHIKHTTQQLRDFYRCGTNQSWAASITHLNNLVDNSLIFFTSGLIYSVVLVVTDNRAVCRNLNNIKLVDIPELTSLGRSCTGHTRELVIHTEVVLQSDGSKGLSCCLYLYVLLSLYSLVQSVAPTATFHNTTSLLVYNLNLAVNNHIFVVLVEHAVSLEQLLQSVNTLALNGVVTHQLVFLVQTLLICETCLSLESRKLCCNIGQYKQLVIIYLLSQPSSTLICKVARVHLLVNHEVQRLNALRHTAVVVLHIDVLCVLHTALDSLLREELDEWLVLRHSLVRTIK